MYPHGITYNLCSEGSLGGGGVVILKNIIFGPLVYVAPNSYLKILIECVCENGGSGRMVFVALQSPSTHFPIKRAFF